MKQEKRNKPVVIVTASQWVKANQDGFYARPYIKGLVRRQHAICISVTNSAAADAIKMFCGHGQFRMRLLFHQITPIIRKCTRASNKELSNYSYCHAEILNFWLCCTTNIVVYQTLFNFLFKPNGCTRLFYYRLFVRTTQ